MGLREASCGRSCPAGFYASYWRMVPLLYIFIMLHGRKLVPVQDKGRRDFGQDTKLSAFWVRQLLQQTIRRDAPRFLVVPGRALAACTAAVSRKHWLRRSPGDLAAFRRVLGSRHHCPCCGRLTLTWLKDVSAFGSYGKLSAWCRWHSLFLCS